MVCFLTKAKLPFGAAIEHKELNALAINWRKVRPRLGRGQADLEY